MQNSQKQLQCDIGIVGLGVMGRNLLLNIADHGFYVAGYDRDPLKVEALRKESAHIKSHGIDVQGATDIGDFIASLKSPRAIMMLVPAGAPVDAVIRDLLPHLEAGDLIIDGGNSHFTDTTERIRELMERNIQFLGVGISGGEEGARHGPSIMPGGAKQAYERVRRILEAVAAKVNDEPCVTYLGPGAAGHYVKMVHNGIEYALMQLISETYDLMKQGLQLNDDELSDVYDDWNKGELSGYLIEITANIFKKMDEKTGERLIDEIRAVAEQKGTGLWTSQSAMELQVPVPIIDLAVAMRDLSLFVDEREQAHSIYPQSQNPFEGNRGVFMVQLRDSLYTAMLLAYSQGFALLRAASDKYAFHLDLEAVARIWRGGCIIRAALLEDISAAFRNDNDLPNLLLDPNLSGKVMEHEKHLRQIICHSAILEIPAPGFMASLAYFDAYRSARLPANLIQAQRDYFGAHTYERIDGEGHFHTQWEAI